MRVVPKGKARRIAFFQARLAKWLGEAEEIGASPELLAELGAAVEEARAAHAAQQAAKQAAQSATLRLDNALARMSRLGAGVISGIRVKALQGGRGVFALASLPAPAKRSPLGPPGRPTGFAVKLNPSGSLTLTWKCKHPRGAVGTLYYVYRRNGLNAPPEFLAAVGERRFTDPTVPRGSPTVTYLVQAVRSTSTGDAAEHIVNFGGGTLVTMSKKVRATVPVPGPAAARIPVQVAA